MLASSLPYTDGAINPTGLGNEAEEKLQRNGHRGCRFLSDDFSTLCVQSRPLPAGASILTCKGNFRNLSRSELYHTVFSALAVGIGAAFTREPSVQIIVRVNWEGEGESDVEGNKGAYSHDVEREREEWGRWSVMREWQRGYATRVEVKVC